jgi:large subunit ribosomal protein L5
MKEKNKQVREIKIEKVVLHCSTVEQGRIERSMKLLKFITGMQPVKTLARKRIPAFKIRPKLPIGCKVTVRGEKAVEVLRKIFGGISYFKKSCFGNGSLNFGVKEYIELPSFPYQREIGILGFDVVVNLTRIGKRVSKRRSKKSTVGIKQRISKEETIEFMKNKFNLNLEE